MSTPVLHPPVTAPMIKSIASFFDTQSSTQAYTALLEPLVTFLEPIRPESHTQAGLSHIISRGNVRATLILRKREDADATRRDFARVQKTGHSKRTTPARKAEWKKKNAHVIAAFNNLKEESLSRLDQAYLLLHQSLHDMKTRGQDAAKRRKEEEEEEKASRREARSAAKRAKVERKEEEKKEKDERKTKEREDRSAADARVRSKQTGEYVDSKLNKLSKAKEQEEDLRMQRELRILAVRVLTKIDNTLPALPAAPSAELKEEEDKEN